MTVKKCAGDDAAIILGFLHRLCRHNDREWFKTHKDEYLEMKEAGERLASRLIALVAEVDPRAASLSVADCTYRIYRDTRFSPDKTPYKDHYGVFVNPPQGKNGETCGYYFHISPTGSFIAAGTGWMSSEVLKAVRRSVYEEIEEYRGIVESPEFRRYFPTVGYDLLKTAPKGYPKDWPWIEYLRPRLFGAEMKVSDDFFRTEGLADRLRPVLAQAYLYNRFINYPIEELLESGVLQNPK